MASPIGISRRNSRFETSEKSTLQAQAPAAAPLLDAESFSKALSQLKSTIVDLAAKQYRCDTLIQDEQRQTKEYARWSKYSDSYPAIGEDQTRNLKATERARNEAQSQVNQANQESDRAIETIARIFLASGSRAPGVADTVIGPAVKDPIGQSEEVINLKEQIASLKVGFIHSQNHHKREIEELRGQLLERVKVAETKLEGKLTYESGRIQKLAEMNTEQERIKASVENLSANKWDKIRTEMESKVEKQSASISQSLKAEIVDELQPRLTESIKSYYKPELDKLTDSITTRISANQESLEKHMDELQTKKVALMASELKPELDSLKSAVSINSSAIATLKPEVSQLTESICSIAEYHETLKVPFQNMVRESTARDQAVKQISGQQEVQNSAMQGLSDKISEIQDTVSDYSHVRSLGEDNKSHIEVCRAELNTEQSSLKARIHAIEKICEQLREQRQASPAKSADCQTPSTGSDGQAVTLDQRLARIDDNIRRLNSRFEAKEQEETERDDAVSNEIGQAWDRLLQLEENSRKHSTSLEQVVSDMEKLSQDHQGQVDKWARLSTSMQQLATDLKILSNTANEQAEKWSSMGNAVNLANEVRQQLDHLRLNQSSTSAALQEIKAEIAMLNESRTSLSDMSVLRNQPYHNAHASPQINGVLDDNEVKPKIEALESKVDHFEMQMTDKVKAMESTLDSHGSRFNNLTTEPLIHSVLYAVQQLYPLQPLQNSHNFLNKEIGTVKQEFSNLTQKQDQLLQKLEAYREIDGKRNAKIHDLIKASARTSDTEHRRSSSTDAATSVLLSEHDKQIKDIIRKDEVSNTDIRNLTTRLDSYKASLCVQKDEATHIKSDIQGLQTRLNTVANNAKEQQTNLGHVKDDFYKAQSETHLKANDLARDVQNQIQKLDLLEKKADAQGKEQARDIKELEHEFREYKESVVASTTTMERDLGALKHSISQDQTRDIEELRRDVRELKESVVTWKETIERSITNLSPLENSVSQDQTKGIEELKHEIHEFKETVTACKATLERDLSALKTNVEAQAGDQQKLEEKVKSQYQEAKKYMDEALNEVVKSVKIDDLLERDNPSIKGDNISKKGGEVQGNAKDPVEIPDESDQEPVKSKPKRSREGSSTNGSVDRPPQKRKRTQLDKDGISGHSDSENSSPRIPLETKKPTSQLSQSSSSLLSPRKRGRPPKERVD
ncbi:MAG: hypothetical protein Q9221_005653 [Calogaya cf. arnoldii]